MTIGKSGEIMSGLSFGFSQSWQHEVMLAEGKSQGKCKAVSEVRKEKRVIGICPAMSDGDT